MNRFNLIIQLAFVLIFGIAATGNAQNYTTKKTAKGKLKKFWDQGMQYNLKGGKRQGH